MTPYVFYLVVLEQLLLARACNVEYAGKLNVSLHVLHGGLFNVYLLYLLL